MNLIARLFGSPGPSAGSRPVSQPHSQPHSHSHPHSHLTHAHSQSSQGPATSQNSMRKELLRVVLRDTLNRSGIPREWVTADMLVATSRTQVSGVHLRLTVLHWDARLMVHSMAFQEKLQQRVVMLDPTAVDWLLSISWLFALPDSSVCPAMPHPGTWTMPVPVPADKVAAPLDELAQTKADLAALLAERDNDLRRHAAEFDAANNFAPTEPSGLYANPPSPRP